MSNLMKHAIHEMDLIGLTEEDEYNASMRKHILKMIEMFSEEGHSGFSARYAISAITKLMSFKPLSPLTGEDDEWHEVTEMSGHSHWQNKRYSSVFKNEDGSCYDIDGKVFWEWSKRPYDEDEEGYPGEKVYKSYYTNRDSHLPVTFPYMPTDEPIYEWRYSDADPQQPAQTEDGFV